ncbi:MAG: hypothetical protein AAB353_01430, partial [Candidatus Hydrogenedentota bacterium]
MDGNFYDCPNCGKYLLSGTAEACLDRLDPIADAVLSHNIWSRHTHEGVVEVYSSHLEVAEMGTLPDPADQADLFILYLGDEQKGSPGKAVLEDPDHLRAKIGASTSDDVVFIEGELRRRGLIIGEIVDQLCGGQLSLEGWKLYRELKRGRSEGLTAFMAMSFKNEEVTKIVNESFRPAVEATGFKLKRVDDDPIAGLIDNKIRVDIQRCRFLIADLTDQNLGAYWEAGYAEGLGKPVIYTCSKAVWDEHRTHF